MAPWRINSEKLFGKNDFTYHFKKIIVCYKNIGYKIDVFRQTACLVVNPRLCFILTDLFRFHCF